MSFALDIVPGFAQLNPALAPSFDGLRPQNFVEDSKNYRDFHSTRIYNELFHGMNGIEACSQFTGVNHHIALSFAENIRLLDNSISVKDFFIKHNLAAVIVGGTAARTMAPQSDFDILIVSADSTRFHKVDVDTEFSKGIRELRTKFWDTMHLIGFSDLGASLYANDYIAEDLPNRGQLETATALLSCEYLYGSTGVFQEFSERLAKEVKANRDALVENIIDELGKRHKEHGFISHHKDADLKVSPGYLRDIDNIRWLKAIVRYSEGQAASDTLLTPDEEIALKNASSIFLQLKFLAQYSMPEGMTAKSNSLNTLTHNRIIPVFQPFAGITSPCIDHGRDAYRLLNEQAENVSEILANVIDRVRRKPADFTPSVYSVLNEAVQSGVPQGEILRLSLKSIHSLVHSFEIPEEGRSLWRMPFEVIQTVGLIKNALRGAPDEIFQLDINRDEFTRIISEATLVKGGLRILYHTGLLTRFVPCFSEIVNFSEIGGYQKSTLDDHSLEAACALRAFFNGELKGTGAFYRNFQYLKAKFELVEAALVHDVGRKRENDSHPHEEIGANLAERDLHNDTVTKLVRLHSLLPKLAFSLSSSDVTELEKAAALIGDRDTLNMLFVLSWVDKLTSNNETFNVIKQRWLYRIYNNLDEIIKQGGVRIPDAPAILVAALTARKEISDFSLENLSVHLNNLPGRYRYECDAEAVAEHVRLVEDLLRGREQADQPAYRLSWVMGPDTDRPVFDLAIVAEDKPGLFRDIAYALYKNNLEIRDAQIYTRSDKIACNLFSLAPRNSDYSALMHEDSRYRLFNSIAAQLEIPPEERIYRQLHIDKLSKPFAAPLNVYFREHGELCIECIDRPGLAFLIGDCLTNQGLTISSAKLNTGNRGIRNLFQVVNSDGSSLNSKQKQAVEIAMTAVLRDQPDLNNNFPLAS